MEHITTITTMETMAMTAAGVHLASMACATVKMTLLTVPAKVCHLYHWICLQQLNNCKCQPHIHSNNNVEKYSVFIDGFNILINIVSLLPCWCGFMVMCMTFSSIWGGGGGPSAPWPPRPTTYTLICTHIHTHTHTHMYPRVSKWLDIASST